MRETETMTRRGDLSHDHCTTCNHELIGDGVWKQMTPEQRIQARAAGQGRHAGRGLCLRCYRRQRVIPATPGVSSTWRPGAHVLEDWQDLAAARAGMSKAEAIRTLAPRMGMSPAALEKALQRHQVAA